MPTIHKTSTLIVSSSGGELRAVNSDGIVIWSIGLSGGLYPAKTYIDLLSDGLQLDLSAGIFASTPADRLTAAVMSNAFESGANPDFQVTSADRMARELQLKLRRLDQTATKYERRMASLQSLNSANAQKEADTAPTVPVADKPLLDQQVDTVAVPESTEDAS